MWAWLFAVTALAGDAALLAERARSALEGGHPDEARRLAAQAVLDDPTEWSAHRLYLKASAAAGLRTLAEAEFEQRAAETSLDAVVWTWWRVSREQASLEDLEAIAAEQPEPGLVALAWSQWRLGERDSVDASGLPGDDPLAQRLLLRASLRGESPRDAIKLGKDWIGDHPEHPDLLDEWWKAPDSRALERARRWGVRQIEDALGADPSPAYLYRALRVLAPAREKDLAKLVMDRLSEEGLGRPLGRESWNPAMLHTMGRVLVRQRDPVAPRGTPAERFEMTVSLAGALLDRGRHDEALHAWQELRVTDRSPRAAIAHARLLVDLERPTEALRVAEEAARAAGTPQPFDAGLMRTAEQAVALAEAHALQTELHLSADRVAEARWAAWVAYAMDPHDQWRALWARTLAVDNDRVHALDPVLVEASMIAPDTDGEVTELLVGTLLRQAAHAELSEGLGLLALASQLRPLDKGVQLLRAERLAEAGHAEAAFVATSIVGADPGALWYGIGEAPAAAAASAWRGALKHHDARVAELHPGTLAEDSSVTDATGATRARVRPGRPMPPWSVSVGPTVFDNGSTSGRALVLTLWASWCGPCKLEMPEIDSVVGELADEGLPVTAVAISIDENERLFRRAKAKRRYEAMVVGWNPAIARELRVAALPTTWVIAPDGTVVDQQTGYDDTFVARLERLLRKHAEK